MKPTRDEILNEPAGPRLNAWVAVYAMGWEPTGLFRDITGNPFPEPMPDYSGEIAAAWQVAEKIGGVCVEKWPEDWNMGQWAACFNLPDGGSSEQVTGATAQEAICRAALLVGQAAKREAKREAKPIPYGGAEDPWNAPYS